MWERTLQDLIRGLRANKKDESKFIAQAVDEIRREIKSKDMELKAGAVLKLTYLEMLGYDMSWAAFHVVEAMSSSKTHLKSVGYLAAAQSFGPDTDVLMLTTNLVKKDLSSSPADVAVALNGLASIITSDLARDMSLDLIAMLNHSRPHIRKRAILVMYKVITKYPDAKEKAMPRLREKLDDTDPGVIAATVNVLCELARRNPEDYLSLAPQLFHLLTTSSNNWMLIKLVKIFGSLSPLEPRLVKKLQPPITDLISTTPAISLLYECVHTCIIGGMLQGTSGHSLARLCVSKLANFLQDDDQNLKYIALLALTKIVPTHPHFIAEYQDMILTSVADQDISINMRALDLVSAMVNRDNLQSIVQQLLSHLVKSDAGSSVTAAQLLAQSSSSVTSSTTVPQVRPLQSTAYRLALAQRIIAICSESTYGNVTDFEWYLSVLVDLAYVASVNIGAAIRDQLVDVVARVRGARRFAVTLMTRLLGDNTFLANAGEEGSCSEVLWAAAFISGEYCSETADSKKLLGYLVQPNLSNLASDIIPAYIQAAIKVFGHWAADLAQRWDDADLPEVKNIVEMVITRARDFASSSEMEVQERAANMFGLFTFIAADLRTYRPRTDDPGSFEGASTSAFNGSTEPYFPKSLYLLQPLFTSYELNPVATNAQASIAVPEGLNLEAWIVAPPKDQIVDEQIDNAEKRKSKKLKKGKGKEQGGKKGNTKANGLKNVDELALVSQDQETPEEMAERERRKADRLERMKDDPYYIVDDRPSRPEIGDVDSIPVVRLDGFPDPTIAQDETRLHSLRDLVPKSQPTSFVVDREGEMPTALLQPKSHELPPAMGSPSEYNDVDDVPPTPNTPVPIKVTRAKKGSTTGKKKRTPRLYSNESTTVR